VYLKWDESSKAMKLEVETLGERVETLTQIIRVKVRGG